MFIAATVKAPAVKRVSGVAEGVAPLVIEVQVTASHLSAAIIRPVAPFTLLALLIRGWVAPCTLRDGVFWRNFIYPRKNEGGGESGKGEGDGCETHILFSICPLL